MLLDQFEPYLRSYIDKFKYKTVTTDQWKEHLLSHFCEQVCWLAVHCDDFLKSGMYTSMLRLSRVCLRMSIGKDGFINLDFLHANQSMATPLSLLFTCWLT